MVFKKKSKIRQFVTACVPVGLVGLGLMLGFLVDLMYYNIRVLYSTSMVINHDSYLEDRTDDWNFRCKLLYCGTSLI